MDPIIKNVRAAMAAALNKTAEQTRNEAIRLITDRYNVDTAGTRSGVKRNVFVAYRANTTRLKAVIKAIGAPLGVVKFPHEQMNTGARISIKGSKRAILRSTFEATMESGHKGIFKRYGRKIFPEKGRYAVRGTIMRQKIKEIFTISAASMFAQKDIFKSTLKHATEIFPRILKNQVEWRNK